MKERTAIVSSIAVASVAMAILTGNFWVIASGLLICLLVGYTSRNSADQGCHQVASELMAGNATGATVDTHVTHSYPCEIEEDALTQPILIYPVVDLDAPQSGVSP